MPLILLLFYRLKEHIDYWDKGLEAEDLTLVWNAIEAVFREEYIEKDIACEALAAIETVARLKGSWGERNSYTETIDNWVESNQALQVPDNLPVRGAEAVDLILGKDSELNELWSESENYDEWKEKVLELRERIIA